MSPHEHLEKVNLEITWLKACLAEKLLLYSIANRMLRQVNTMLNAMGCFTFRHWSGEFARRGIFDILGHLWMVDSLQWKSRQIAYSEGVSMTLFLDHAYLPISWIKKERPMWATKLEALEQKIIKIHNLKSLNGEIC